MTTTAPNPGLVLPLPPKGRARPEAVALAKALSRKRPKGGQMSLRAVSAEMAARGFLNERGALQPQEHCVHACGVASVIPLSRLLASPFVLLTALRSLASS
jgi:hypothetical protein